MHSTDGQLLDVVVLRVLGRIPDEPQLQPVEEVVAGQVRDSHVKEHALQHGPGQELQHWCQEECRPNEHVNPQLLSPELISPNKCKFQFYRGQ